MNCMSMPKSLDAQQVHHFLQGVAILAGNAHQVALDRRLHFLLAVLDHLHDFAGFLDAAMPCCSVISWRTVEPAAGVTVP